MSDLDKINSLRVSLKEVLQLPESAVDWLAMLFQSIQVLDDVADGDKVERAALDAAIWHLLVMMPSNQFFLANAGRLLPLIQVAILKWQASDIAERSREADAKSFVWRAGFYDIVLASVAICHGIEFAQLHAHYALSLYGETLADYLKEFDHA